MTGKPCVPSKISSAIAAHKDQRVDPWAEVPSEHLWIKEGVKADFYSKIGGPVTYSGVIRSEPFVSSAAGWCVATFAGEPGHFPCDHIFPAKGTQ